jgi:hypothetical protein
MVPTGISLLGPSHSAEKWTPLNSRFHRYYEPLRHPKAPGLSLAGVRLAIPDHAKGLPVLRTLSLCTCCRHYPGAVTGGAASLIHPVISAFPERVAGSACASAFSRFARRSLALRPAHSRCHQFVTRFTRRLQPFRYLHSCSGCFRLERLPGGACTRWKKRRLFTAHTHCCPSVSFFEGPNLPAMRPFPLPAMYCCTQWSLNDPLPILALSAVVESARTGVQWRPRKCDVSRSPSRRPPRKSRI